MFVIVHTTIHKSPMGLGAKLPIMALGFVGSEEGELLKGIQGFNHLCELKDGEWSLPNFNMLQSQH